MRNIGWFAGMTFSLATFAVAAQNNPSFVPWRTPANGGINALYCYLQTHGIRCDYAKLLAEQALDTGGAPCTAVTLEHLAAKNGWPLYSFKLTPAELAACSKPVLVHMEGESRESGAFLLLLSYDKRQINYLNGPTATIETMRPDDFERVWSGIALLPARRYKRDVWSGIAGMLAGSALVLILRRTQTRRLL